MAWFSLYDIKCFRRKASVGRFKENLMERFSCTQCSVFRQYLIPIQELYSFFVTFALLSSTMLSNKLLDIIGYAWDRETQSYKFTCLGMSPVSSQLLGMQNICRGCFAFLHAVSLRKLQRLITGHKTKRQKTKARRDGSGRSQSPKMMQAIIWFALLVHLIGESSPDSPTIHLPPGFRRDYFREYLADNVDQETLHRTAFYEMWKKNYPNVKVRIDVY